MEQVSPSKTPHCSDLPTTTFPGHHYITAPFCAPEGPEHPTDAPPHGKDWFQRLLSTQRDVPDVHPECECGWPRQAPKHVVVNCPLLPGRESLWAAAGTPSYDAAIHDPRGAAAITAWLLSNCGPNRLAQFTVAKDLFCKNKPHAAPLPEWWDSPP